MLESAGFFTTPAHADSKYMRAASTVIAIGIAIGTGTALELAPMSAHALGLGKVSNGTQLGQTLNFAVAVRLDADEALLKECVAAEVFSGDNRVPPGQVQVALEGNPEANDRTVRVTSGVIIDEPVVTVSVTLGCTAKVTRKFVAFIDPPLVNLAQAASTTVEAPPAVAPRVDPPAMPVQAPAQASLAATAPVSAASAVPREEPAEKRATPDAAIGKRQSAAAGKPVVVAREAGARKPATPARPVVVTRPPAATTGPRLQLEARPAVVARPASAASEARSVVLPAVAASAPALEDQAVSLEKERQRMVVLEEGLARLRGDSQATQKTVAALQGRLQEAESQRYANPLVYALAGLSGLLALAVAALWWRQSRSRPSGNWWSAPNAAASVEPPADPVAPTALLEGAALVTEPAAAIVAVVAPPAPALVPLAVPRTASVTPPSPAPDEPAHEVSVEELIDLEQQSEFFVVLGQDDAAIALLMGHVRSDGGASPLPYLKLLEIYRRRGENDAYERIRERFNRRFNAYAPDWNADLQQGRVLEDYPQTIARLHTLWKTPTRAMEALDAALFRRDKSDETFDLPAYRELLFLYSIACDLAEHGASGPNDEIDLLLPLVGSDPAGQAAAHLTLASGQTGDFGNSELMTLPLDLDVTLGTPPVR
jgi:hypothetical protein